jgi:hypothetical protein
VKSKANQSIRTGAMTVLGLGLWIAANSSSAACLQKAGPPGALGPTYVFMLAPASAISTYLSLGFTQIDCPSDMRAFRAYVAQLCAVNGQGSAPPLNSEAAIGVPLVRACADAQAGLTEAGG